MSPKKRSQKGSVYIVAIFVVVVMGMLAMNLNRIQWSGNDTLSRELIGTKASLLASSGVEWALTQLYPLGQPGSSAELAVRCNNLSPELSTAASYLTAQVDKSCRALFIQCETVTGGETALIPEELQYFKVTSRALCGDTKGFDIERQQEAWVKGVSQ
ncbi:hypothetical protein [Vibrio hangzhouensis]|uniref:MSHA biogenesis protein MshP n=1 Tax=Vibrio hangzhouensis TaxID=462991 RepID=A0A1H5U6W6_9VIBR|nr:hypothetical protein [Vibrio hangzhouensis]SEF70763.1 MSHA biogenesis protein MshP [Vibrio hangzhouensis]